MTHPPLSLAHTAILRAVAKHGGAFAFEIAREVGREPESIQPVLDSLVDGGYLARKRGIYAIPPGGINH